MKTRYAKPFEGMQVKIPYETGMSPYSGLTDLAEKKGMLKKEGNRLVFVTSEGEIIKQFRKAWEAKLRKQNIKIDTHGVLKCFCKKCGLNTTHSTGFHKVYVLNPAGFSLPDSHPYIIACAQLRALQGTHTPAPKPPPTTQTSGEKTTGGHAGSISRAHIEQKLADLERTSTDPNAASIAETIRSIFLN